MASGGLVRKRSLYTYIGQSNIAMCHLRSGFSKYLPNGLFTLLSCKQITAHHHLTNHANVPEAVVVIRHNNYRDFMNIQVAKRAQLLTKRTLERIYLVSFFWGPTAAP